MRVVGRVWEVRVAGRIRDRPTTRSFGPQGLSTMNGTREPWVYLVGAGPGDPELLTIKAERALKQADAVVYDRLVGERILDLVPRGATRIYVGKASKAHHLRQDEINELLLEHARGGKRVVRLKGGDPFIFGRGGEEVEHLRRHGIAVELVPGITAATASAASAGIPLTHRGLAQAVTLVTGHGAEGEPDIDWAALAGGNHTLAIYMGLSNAGRVAEQLIAGGRAPGTPVAEARGFWSCRRPALERPRPSKRRSNGCSRAAPAAPSC